MAKGSGHTANSLVSPDTGVGLCWPPSSPELNPIARLWQDGTAPVAWRVATARDAWAHRVAMLITHYSRATMRSLTA